MAKPKTYSPPFYTASPTVGPYSDYPDMETLSEIEARRLVTSDPYYKYLRSLPNYPEVQGWRPDYKNRFQDPVKYGGTEGFEPTATAFASTPAGYIRGVADRYSPNARRYYYKNQLIDGRWYSPNDPYASTGNVVRALEALRYGQTHGAKLPKVAVDPYFIAARYLKEFRDEGGANDPAAHTYSAPAREAMERAMLATGDRFGTDAAMGLAQAIEKGRVSRKMGLDFFKAWNGTGKADKEAGGGGGSNYAYRMRHDFIPAAHHKRNAAFVDFIRRQLDPNAPYTTPMTKQQYYELDRIYGERQRAARKGVMEKLDNNLLRQLQWGIFGGNKYFGVPDEYNPFKAEDAVKPPDYVKLTGLANPVSGYKQGGLASLLKKGRR